MSSDQSPPNKPSESTKATPSQPVNACCQLPQWGGWCILGATAVGVLILGLLLLSIAERRNEAKLLDRTLYPIDAMETDSAKWAVNWPREYSSYAEMADDTTETKYGGAYPRDYLKETPANVILFGGYGFAKEYRQARGHVYTIEDVTQTARVNAKTPATCWTCKSPDVPRLMAEYGRAKLAGSSDGDTPGGDATDADLQTLVMAGAGEFYSQNFDAMKPEITHPIGCLDCHDPENMALRITRPALIEAFERQGRDINKVSHQEMRSLVCAQCHVEYYFKGDGKYLTFPWDGGMGVEKVEEYYDTADFADWTHAISGTRMVKMQHPDYEVYSTGIHAARNVACADCHMPYRTEGGMKFTNHHIQSPLLDISSSCAVCHRWGEDEIRNRVKGIQDKVREGRTMAETALVRAHFDVAACRQAGATDEELETARDLLRSAQLYWDYVAANNGMGFHSPQECSRILGIASDRAQQSRLMSSRILARHGYTQPVAYPDVSTKEQADAVLQSFINPDTPQPDLLAL